MIYPREKGEYVSEHPASPDVWDTAKEAHFTLKSSRVPNHDSYEVGRVTDRTLRKH